MSDEVRIAREAKTLLDFLYPFIKGNMFDLHVALAHIKKPLREAEERGRRDAQREAHLERHVNAPLEGPGSVDE